MRVFFLWGCQLAWVVSAHYNGFHCISGRAHRPLTAADRSGVPCQVNSRAKESNSDPLQGVRIHRTFIPGVCASTCFTPPPRPNSCPVLPGRNRLALITKRPSMIAKDFMHPTRHSVLSSRSSSSSDASYIDCAFASPPPEPIEEDDTSSESHDDISVHTRPHPPLKQARTLQIIPTLPLTKHKRRSDTHKSKDLSASMSALNAMLSPPKSAATKGNQLIKQRSDTTEIFRQSKTLGRKTPHQRLRKLKGASQLGQTGQTMPLTRRRAHHQPPLDARYSMSDIIIPAPMTPSDSIHITSPIPPQSQPPVISEQAEASKLKRQSAFKRKSLLHLGLECLTYDVSEYTTHISVATSHVLVQCGGSVLNLYFMAVV